MKKLIYAASFALVLCSLKLASAEKLELQLNPHWTNLNESAPTMAKSKRNSKPNWTMRVLWGLTGAFAGAQVHELAGHYLAAELLDGNPTYKVMKVSVDWPNLETSESSESLNHKRRLFNLSGFIAQGVSAEFMLSMPFVSKDNAFVIGYIAHAVIEPLFNVIRHETSGDSLGCGDLCAYERNGGNVHLVEGILVAHSLWLATGLLTHRDFWTYMSPQENGATIGVGKRF